LIPDSKAGPIFSVIIPTYNRADFVTEAVDSVLRQSFKDYEIIVIDDGSTDTTTEALEQYGRTITVMHQANRGVSAARNAGIRKANGTWIAFLDSDDEWNENYLARQWEQISFNPDVIAFITNAINIDVGGRSLTHFENIILKRFGMAAFVRVKRPFRTIMKSHWFLQSTVVRRDVLLRTGLFDTSLTIAEDRDIMARVALEGEFGFNKEVLVEIYRRTEPIRNLASARGSMQARKGFEKVFESLRRDRRLRSMERLTLAKVRSANQRELGNLLLAQADAQQARVAYRQALTTYPSLRSLIKYLVSLLPARFALIVVRWGRWCDRHCIRPPRDFESFRYVRRPNTTSSGR
jgi:glycosyltransferase involved in cell wall biosynthesis